MGIPPQFFNGMDIHLLAILRNIGDVNGQQRGVWYHQWIGGISSNEASIPQKSAEILVPCSWSWVVSHKAIEHPRSTVPEDKEQISKGP